MRRLALLSGCLSALCCAPFLAAQEVHEIDAEAIEKAARANAASAQEFVRHVFEQADREKADATVVADATARSLANAPDSLKQGSIAGASLDQIIAGAGAQLAGNDDARRKAAPVLVAFASTAMPEQSLQRMIADVSKAGGVVVFRGFLPDGSKPFLAQLQKVIQQGDQAHVRIDPRLFRAFDVREVPTYVAVSSSFDLCDSLDCKTIPTPFDTIRGNVTTAYALQTFADGNGPGAAVARAGLHNLERTP
jgi:conjugal transfer pilus assembly protein TrbC